MATKFKKPSKKSLVIAIVGIVLLLVVGITGTVAFLRDRGQTEAADLATEQMSSAENEEAIESDENSNQTTEQNQQQEANINEEQTQVGNEATESESTTTVADNIQESTISRTETVEIPERQILDENHANWEEMNINADIASARVSTQSDDVVVEKSAQTKTGNNLVTRGEEIIYTIKVTNNSDRDLNSVEIKDSIPEKTTYVANSADNDATEVKGGEIVTGLIWNLDIKANSSITVSFKVIVNNDAEGTIENIALANGENDKVETSVITANKTAEVLGKESNKPAALGDKIKYTISIDNQGSQIGKTIVKDENLKTILENAEMDGKVLVNDKETNYTSTDLINGIEINLEKGNTTVSFTVKLTKLVGTIYNVATVGEEETNIVETKVESNIYFIENGGTDVSDMHGIAGEKISDTKMPNTEREGYVFDGWYADETYTEKVEVLPTEYPAGDTYYYAKWNIRTDLEGIINYYEYGTTNKLAESDELKGLTYQTEMKGTAKEILGYKLAENETTTKSIIVSANNNENVINFYYVKDESQTNKLEYIVNHITVTPEGEKTVKNKYIF